jgi:hypothetical protein
MAAVDTLLFATAAGFALIVAGTILVIIGVHQEERRVTFSDRRPPTIPALLARRVLGAYVRLLDEDRAEQGEPGKESDGKYAARPPEC